jgi:hypothetical protein
MALLRISHKFKDGTNPAGKIKELRSVILKAIDLGAKVTWRLTGKGMVTVMSERGNNFAQMLSKYTAVGGIVDPEDCMVELNRMFTYIEEVVTQMEVASIDVKRVMAARVMSLETTKTKGKPGVNPVVCWYGDGCTQTDCSFTHEKGSKKDKDDKKDTGRILIGGKLDSLGMRNPPMGAECIVWLDYYYCWP